MGKTREERLEEALRENLRRRKEQGRARMAVPPETPPPETPSDASAPHLPLEPEAADD